MRTEAVRNTSSIRSADRYCSTAPNRLPPVMPASPGDTTFPVGEPARLRGLLCHVNAIPLNPTTGYTGKPTSRPSALLFRNELERAGIACTVRVRRGIDIAAGCGQLAGD